MVGRASFGILVVLAVGLAAAGLAVTLGQVDDFEDGTVMGWTESGGSSNPPVNVADGGPEGTGDNYLENESSGGAGASGRMEMFNSTQWAGDYIGAGINSIAARVANFGSGDNAPNGTDPDLHIRLAVTRNDLTTRYGSTRAAVIPPDGEWRFVVWDLADMGLISGTATLDDVLLNVSTLRVVSAEAGPAWNGDQVDATLGLDLFGAYDLSVSDQGTQPGLTHAMRASTARCAACHGFDYNDTLDVEPWDAWAGTMMAQATRDPLFWAALDVANNDVPGVGDFCLRCHTPAAWLEGRSEPNVDGCALEGTIDSLDQDFDGVTCHTCHRMMVNESPPAGEDSVYFENAQFWIDDTDCDGLGEPCRRGPYDYDNGDGTAPPHTWAYSAYHETSGICGNCHNVTSPVETLIDGGVDTGIPFPIERTYTEWQQSDFNDGGPAEATCQNCHMPDETSDPASPCLFGNNQSGHLPKHFMAGGNTWIPDVIAGEYPDLGLGDQLAATKARALDMLQNQSATIEVMAPSAPSGGVLDADVKVTNLSGHKLPTGYPEGRRMWLHVEARDAFDTVFWESGAYDAATGVLTYDGQIKVYEKKPGIWDYNGASECDAADDLGSPIFHFVKNNCIALDNRIPPLGFTGGDDPETQPVGYVYPETMPGSGVLVNYDVTPYAIPVPLGTAEPITVTATLRYQTASKEYVEFLLAESNEHNFPNDCIGRNAAPGTQTQTRAEYLFDVWNNYGKSPPVDMVVASATTTCFSLSAAHTGPGADPLASPPNSTGCLAGSYLPGESIELTATPDDGWVVDGWTGTDNDASTGEQNALTMPAAAAVVSVAYGIPSDLTLTAETVDSTRLFQACNSITAGQDFEIEGPAGSVLFRAGASITLANNFRVLGDAAWAAEIDPALCD